MPNFSLSASHEYWFRFKDQSVYRVINIMESIEQSWTIDGNEALEQALIELGDCMDDIDNIDLKQQDRFIQAAAHLKISRMLRILQALDTAYPGAAAKLLEYAEKTSDRNASAKLFLSRNVIFERLRLLSRLLSPERLVLIQSAVEEFKHV